MSKTPLRIFKKRPPKTHKVLKTKFESNIRKMMDHFFESQSFNHALTKGEEREVPFINFLSSNLPSIYSSVKGEVIDLQENSSPQLDVMLFDSSLNVPFYTGETTILPAEALLASIEVKSKLTKNEIRKSLKSVQQLKSLKPFGKELDKSIQRRDPSDRVTCRYFHCLYSYTTDLAEKDWAQKEFNRIKAVAAEEKIDYKILDRVVVIGKGLINPTYEIAKQSKDDGGMLLHYYMDLLNFLQRENNRRQMVPYQEYAGKMSQDWIKL